MFGKKEGLGSIAVMVFTLLGCFIAMIVFNSVVLDDSVGLAICGSAALLVSTLFWDLLFNKNKSGQG